MGVLPGRLAIKTDNLAERITLGFGEVAVEDFLDGSLPGFLQSVEDSESFLLLALLLGRCRSLVFRKYQSCKGGTDMKHVKFQ